MSPVCALLILDKVMGNLGLKMALGPLMTRSSTYDLEILYTPPHESRMCLIDFWGQKVKGHSWGIWD